LKEFSRYKSGAKVKHGGGIVFPCDAQIPTRENPDAQNPDAGKPRRAKSRRAKSRRANPDADNPRRANPDAAPPVGTPRREFHLKPDAAYLLRRPSHQQHQRSLLAISIVLLPTIPSFQLFWNTFLILQAFHTFAISCNPYSRM
jgi:hypothetical protein